MESSLVEDKKGVMLSVGFGAPKKKSILRSAGDLFRSREEIEKRDKKEALISLAEIAVCGVVLGASIALGEILFGKK